MGRIPESIWGTAPYYVVVGDAASAATTLRIYSSTDAPISTSDTELGNGARHRCLACPAVPGAIGQRCPAPAVARLCRRVGRQRVPGLDSRTVISDGSARRVDDVCGPRLVRGVGTRRCWVLPSSSVGEESLSPNHPDTSSRF